jgi:hypothetical protein
VVLFLALNLAAIILSMSFFLGKSQKIFQQRFNDGTPLATHKRFFQRGALAVLLVQGLVLVYSLIADKILFAIDNSLTSGITAAAQVPWAKLLLAGPAVLVAGFAVMFWAARGIKALALLAKYKVKVVQPAAEPVVGPSVADAVAVVPLPTFASALPPAPAPAPAVVAVPTMHAWAPPPPRPVSVPVRASADAHPPTMRGWIGPAATLPEHEDELFDPTEKVPPMWLHDGEIHDAPPPDIAVATPAVAAPSRRLAAGTVAPPIAQPAAVRANLLPSKPAMPVDVPSLPSLPPPPPRPTAFPSSSPTFGASVLRARDRSGKGKIVVGVVIVLALGALGLAFAGGGSSTNKPAATQKT